MATRLSLGTAKIAGASSCLSLQPMTMIMVMVAVAVPVRTSRSRFHSQTGPFPPTVAHHKTLSSNFVRARAGGQTRLLGIRHHPHRPSSTWGQHHLPLPTSRQPVHIHFLQGREGKEITTIDAHPTLPPTPNPPNRFSLQSTRPVRSFP